MLTDLHKDLFAVLVKHWGDYDSLVKTNPRWANTQKTLNEAMCLWAFISKKGNQVNAAERIVVNRNTLRKHLKSVFNDIPKDEIVDRRQFAHKIGISHE